MSKYPNPTPQRSQMRSQHDLHVLVDCPPRLELLGGNSRKRQTRTRILVTIQPLRLECVLYFTKSEEA